jgi:CheY-like chemotaxis protein
MINAEENRLSKTNPDANGRATKSGTVVEATRIRSCPEPVTDSTMSLKVLIVEDDAPSLELMCEVLASVGAEVRPVDDSEEAAALVRKERFDGVFLDLQMPKMHGFELTARIRQSPWNKSIPIIVVTGREDRKTMQEAFKAGATFFLQKPIDRQKLLRLFRTARGTMFENRRRFVRVPLKTEVVCEIRGQTTKGTSWNISQGGILFEAAHLRLGDQVRLSFRLPANNITVDAVGGVVRVDEQQRAGVQFAHVNDAGRSVIRELVDRLST